MTTSNLLPGISSLSLATSRLRAQHLLASGSPDGVPVVFVHGNVSSSRFFEETLAALPPSYRCLAPDLRGFGDSERAPIDATRGVRDFSDDVAALLEHPDLRLAGKKVHLVGWSAGAGVVMQLAMDHPERVASLVLIAPMSPAGFGGTRGDATVAPCWADHAGSGGGTANPEFVRRIAARDLSEEHDTSPRNVMNRYYFKPPLRPERFLLHCLAAPGALDSGRGRPDCLGHLAVRLRLPGPAGRNTGLAGRRGVPAPAHAEAAASDARRVPEPGWPRPRGDAAGRRPLAAPRGARGLPFAAARLPLGRALTGPA